MGGLKRAVVAVADLDLVAVFAAEGEVGLVAEEDDLLVDAVLDEDGDSLGWVVGDEVDGALDGVEVAGAVGRYDDAGGVGGGRGGLGGEGPGVVSGEAREVARLGEDAGVDLDDVFVAVVQDVIVRIDGGYVAMDDDGVEVKVGETTDGGELVVVQVGGGGSDGRSCGGGRCGGVGVPAGADAGGAVMRREGQDRRGY